MVSAKAGVGAGRAAPVGLPLGVRGAVGGYPLRREVARMVRAIAEVAAWWAGLTGMYVVLISTVDPVELAVGGGAALLAGIAGRAARRAVGEW